MKFSLLFWGGVVLAGVLVVYEVKYEVRDLKQRVGALDAQIASEREALHVLRAEWAYLSRPERLQALSQKYLTLGPVKPTQMQDSATLALPEPVPEPEGNTLVSATGVRP